jgi:acyl-CoA oxidase
MFRSAISASRLCSQRLTFVASAPGWRRDAAVASSFAEKRYFADTSVIDTSDDDWAHAFKSATVGVAELDPTTIDYATSAQRMRELLQTKLLRHTDLRDNPERFFLAHRILAEHSSAVGPGFWVRFTVHYNLCAGTVLALGTEEQVADLVEMQDKGELGCFSLTEKLAGVNSGLVVGTVAEWDDETQTFNLNSPNEGAQKNWISQGLCADKTVVVADLRIKGKSYGPHAFIINLRENGKLVPGITTQDMGPKTVGNDLDNASIAFDNVVIPKSALLSRFADIDENNEYVQKIEGLPVFHMIGQRLFTGRVAVAQAAMAFRHGLFDKTKAFADNKKCWAPKGGELMLSGIPQLKALFQEAEEDAAKLDAFVGECERRLCECLRKDKLPSIDLVEAIACAKVKCVENSIKACHRLQNEVGSYALMAGTGFENIDFLVCCKFAEGDSRILMQKMSRDRMKRFIKKDQVPNGVDEQDWDAENTACALLQKKMGNIMSEQGLDYQEAWDANWMDVYAIAELIMDRTMKSFMK